MSVQNSRTKFKISDKKLNRARRLYKFIVAPYINQYPELALVLGYRAIKAGLYAEVTTVKDASFALLRATKNRYYKDKTWWDYVDTHLQSDIWWGAKNYFSNEKGILRQTRKVRIKIRSNKSCNV